MIWCDQSQKGTGTGLERALLLAGNITLVGRRCANCQFALHGLVLVWWVEGCNFPDQSFGLHAFNATLRHQTMSIGEGLGPGVYMAITLNKPSPTAGLASLAC